MLYQFVRQINAKKCITWMSVTNTGPLADGIYLTWTLSLLSTRQLSSTREIHFIKWENTFDTLREIQLKVRKMQILGPSANCIFLTETLSLLSSTSQPALQMNFNELTPHLTPGSPIVLLLHGWTPRLMYCHVKCWPVTMCVCRCTCKWEQFSFARIDQIQSCHCHQAYSPLGIYKK